ncbi:hypothetical protein AKJ16_DCAP22801 [Drosera capensis]
MASAQVLSNSMNRKQDLLEAGKRRLEEFGKKKAADRARAKTTASTRQSQTSSSSADKKHALENGQKQISNHGDASASSEFGGAAGEPAGVVVENAEGLYGFSDSFADFLSEPPKKVKDEVHLGDASTSLKEANAIHELHSDLVGDSGSHIEEGTSTQGTLFKSDTFHLNNGFGYYGSGGVQTNGNHGLGTKPLGVDSRIPDVVENKNNSIRPGSDFQEPGPFSGRSILGAMDTNSITVSGVEQRSSHDYTPIFLCDLVQVSDSQPLGFNLGVGKSARHSAISLPSLETTTRSHPSLRDSLDIPRNATSSDFSQNEPQRPESATFPSTSIMESMLSEKPILDRGTEMRPTRQDSRNIHGRSVDNAFTGLSIHDSFVERNLEPRSHKQNEDSAALEQVIDLLSADFPISRFVPRTCLYLWYTLNWSALFTSNFCDAEMGGCKCVACQ